MIGHAAFFNGPYDETMALLVESRNYVANRIEIDQRPMSVSLRLQVSFESMRLTARLTQMMAWLLAQKAVHAGEIAMEELASDRFALGGDDICRNNDGATRDDMPDRLRRLLARSYELYLRIARLDADVRRRVARHDGDGPPSAQSRPILRLAAQR